MKSFNESFLKYGTYGLAFLLPLIYFGNFVYPYTTPKAFFFYGFVEILFVFWVYFLMKDPSYRLSKRQLLLFSPLFAYVSWMSIAGIFAFNPGLALWSSLLRTTGLLTLYHGLCFSMIITSLSNKYGAWFFIEKLLYYVVASGAVLGITVWCGDEGFNLPFTMLKDSGGGGQIGNSSLAAAYLMFILGFTAILFFSKNILKSTKIRLGIVFGIILFSPLFLNIHGLFVGRGLLGSARGATLGLIVSLLVSLIIYFITSKNKVFKATSAGVFGSGVILFIILWVKLLTPGTLINESFLKNTSGARFVFWEIAQKAMDERPFVGYGPENYSIAIQHYFNPKLLDKNFEFGAWADRAHNTYYDIGVSGGYPALVFYVLFLASLIYASYSSYRADIFSRVQFGIICGIVAGYLFQGLFIFDGLVSLFILFVFSGILMGASLNKNPENGNVLKINRFIEKPVMFLLCLGLIFGVYNFSYAPTHKAKLFGEILGAKIDQKAERYLELLGGSVVGNHWDVGTFAHDEYKLYARNPVAVKSDAKILPYAQKDVLAFTEYAEEIAKDNTNNYELYLSIIHLYSTYIYLKDLPYDPALAKKLLVYADYARILAPNDPEIYWAYAQLAAWQGDIPGVVAYYKQGIACDPELEVSHRLLLVFLKGIGSDKKIYNEALANAQANIPEFTINN